MEVAELKMLRFSFGISRMPNIRNEYVRGTARVGRFGEKYGGGVDMYGGKMMGISENDVEDGAARKEETGKAYKEVYGCGERGHDSGGSDEGRCRR